MLTVATIRNDLKDADVKNTIVAKSGVAAIILLLIF